MLPGQNSWMGALSLRWRLSTGLQAHAMGCLIHSLQAGTTSVPTLTIFFFAIRMRPPHALLPPPFHLHTHIHWAALSSTLHSYCTPIHANFLTIIFPHGLPHAAGAARVHLLDLFTELLAPRVWIPRTQDGLMDVCEFPPVLRCCAVHHW